MTRWTGSHQVCQMRECGSENYMCRIEDFGNDNVRSKDQYRKAFAVLSNSCPLRMVQCPLPMFWCRTYYRDSWNNSLPISMRRISLVPAPIS